ncbi:zinc-dependent alcohol dehydrogenase [Deinococcus yavapaiensis]|uniref:zinc-dependent alcohol dehydrogenase n=1 Tax=Deinococcus yavapaiensis TaxID=309889 RepID=UPI001FEA8A29|nr:zinc-binding alcohol dehydrogenase [Deinococcus yavapaiensis]
MRSIRATRLVLNGVRELALEQFALPEPGALQVVLRTRLSAVSVSSELGVVEGRVPTSFPTTLGYQTLGVVEAVGEGVTLPIGTRVVTTLGHASAGVVPEARCLVVPPHVSDRAALAAILGEETFKGVRKLAASRHESVLIAGAGLLGLLTVFNLTRRGVSNVTVVEPNAERRALAETFGAVATSPGHLAREDFDVGFECSASPEGFAELLSHLRPRGRACVLSDGNWGALTLPRAFHERELSVVASSDGEDYQGYAAWLWTHSREGLERLFETTVAPSDVPSTFERLRRPPRPVSVVVDWSLEGS